jgi:AraC-like DNA-binding protein
MQMNQGGHSGDTRPTGAANLAALPDLRSCRDPVIEQLAYALLPAEKAGEVLRGFYTEALHSTLLARLATMRGEANSGSATRKSIPLATFRLKRVYEYVETHLDERLPLSSLATAAGLSRMHFAAQFRAATGQSPHGFVWRRRIQHAKALLSETDTPIVQIALSVGFQSQAHFTTVFKRITGFTPKRWRLMRGEFHAKMQRPVTPLDIACGAVITGWPPSSLSAPATRRAPAGPPCAPDPRAIARPSFASLAPGGS